MSNFQGLDNYDRDDDLESAKGISVDLAPGISIQILRAGGANRKYARVFTKVTAPYQRRLQANQLDAETSDRLYHEIYAKSIVIGWTGIRRKGDTEDQPCTVENVTQLFAEQPDIFDLVKSIASDMEQFRIMEIEDLVEPLGNS